MLPFLPFSLSFFISEVDAYNIPRDWSNNHVSNFFVPEKDLLPPLSSFHQNNLPRRIQTMIGNIMNVLLAKKGSCA